MRVDQHDPDSLRWKIASAVGPERVALALVIVLAISILLIVRLGPSQGDVDVSRPSPAPSAALSRSWNGRQALVSQVRPDRREIGD